MRNDLFFFFQAKAGIRDLPVTGVQTCALPISLIRAPAPAAEESPSAARREECNRLRRPFQAPPPPPPRLPGHHQIGRASGRGRVEISGVGGSLKKKK